MSVVAHWAITALPVAGAPTNESLSTPAEHSAAPVAARPVTMESTGRPPTTSVNASTMNRPTAGVCSLGLYTTQLPAASADTTAPPGV